LFLHEKEKAGARAGLSRGEIKKMFNSSPCDNKQGEGGGRENGAASTNISGPETQKKELARGFKKHEVGRLLYII